MCHTIYYTLCCTICYTLCRTTCYTLCHTICYTLCHTTCYTLHHSVCHTMCYALCHRVSHFVLHHGISTGQPRYLSSLFLAGSSLSEDVSQFDFSTGAHVIPSLHPHQQSYNNTAHVSHHGPLLLFIITMGTGGKWIW